ncbi:hypothetical protein GCM10009689_30250 [Brevibacterium antiquum]|uniref:GNAT family N-acetyltransferase n=1 Tax=Brevibacterium antiquum TaxID=234835 RepID=UPI0018DFBE3E|nr:GNAT family N-acetyltransferase [Brevibacterium antiquum]
MNSARAEVEIIRLRPREVLQASGRLVKVQRRAYRVEAAFIDDHRIPQLTESAEKLSAAELNWHVALTGSAIIAAIAYTDTGPSLEVDRLFVEPSWHRLGLARRLILSLDSKPIDVSTGRENQPARRLYESLGFSHLGNAEALPGLWLSQYRRPR